MGTKTELFEEFDAVAEIILILKRVPEHRQVAVLAMVPLFMDSDNYQAWEDGDSKQSEVSDGN